MHSVCSAQKHPPPVHRSPFFVLDFGVLTMEIRSETLTLLEQKENELQNINVWKELASVLL